MKLMIISHTRRKDRNNPYGWVHRGLRVLPSLGVNVRYCFSDEIGRLADIRRKFKPDLVLTLGPIGAYILFMKKLGFWGNIPIGHDWHDNYIETMGRKYGRNLMRKIQNYILKNADFVTTPSLSRFQYLNIVRTDIFHWMHGAEKNKGYLKFGMHTIYIGDGCNFIYIGEISPEKGVDKLIHAVSKVPKANLFLLGKVSDISNKLPKNIHLVGQVPFKDINFHINFCDVCVLTQDNDSSIKMSQYFAAKKPIIGPAGELESYDEYIDIVTNWEETIRKYTNLYLKKGKLKPKKIFPIKTEEEYMKEYIDFLSNYHGVKVYE